MLGVAQPTETSTAVGLTFLGEEASITVTMATGDLPLSLLGLDLPKGRTWQDNVWCQWSFGTTNHQIKLLQMAPDLPPTKLTDVKLYPLPLGAGRELPQS